MLAPMPPATTDEVEIDSLIAAGRHAEAAAMLVERGELQRAESVLEKIWDFAGAAAIAQMRGDRVAWLRFLVEARDAAGVAQAMTDLLASGLADEQRAAAEV